MFVQNFTATKGDIDELGHVNNAVWVVWAQEVAVAHWRARAHPDHVDAYIWVIVRHEIDYAGNIAEGDPVEARTHVVGEPAGARFERRVEFFRPGEARPIVRVLTRWAMIARATGRPARITPEIVAPFIAERDADGAED